MQIRIDSIKKFYKMLTEDNTFDFLRQINDLESNVNTFYYYFSSKNIQLDESYIQLDESYIQLDESYINFLDKINNLDKLNEPNEFLHNELLLNKNKEIILDFREDVDNNIEIDKSYINLFEKIINLNKLSEPNEFKIKKETKDKKTKIKDSPSKINNLNNINYNYKPIKKKYSCNKCGKLYANYDAVRKHWKKKHNEFELERGNIDSYTTIITKTGDEYKDNKINLSSYNIDLTCNESLENFI